MTADVTAELLACLEDLVACVDVDHEALAAATAGRITDLPGDARLRPLQRTLVLLRLEDPHASALELLAVAAEEHPVEVREHLDWLAARGAGERPLDPVPLLAVPAPLRLAS
jgi:hypothetical protein